MQTETTTLIDTHVHLDACVQTIADARRAGVADMVVPGVAPEGWDTILQLAENDPLVHAAPGVHPQAAASWSPQVEQNLRQRLDHPRVVAVGEIGLDRLLDTPSMETQRQVFRAQLRLAVTLGKPVLIHCRKAYGDLISILIEERAEKVGGILHAFGGSLETALTAIDLGFVIAFGGSLTWPGSKRAAGVLAGLPPTAIVLESDAPDMAPHPHRGEENRPAWLGLIADAVGEVRGWSREEVARITGDNARRVLGLPARGA